MFPLAMDGGEAAPPPGAAERANGTNGTNGTRKRGVIPPRTGRARGLELRKERRRAGGAMQGEAGRVVHPTE